MRKLIVLLLIGVVFVAGCIGNGQTSTQGTGKETPQETISSGETQNPGEETPSAGETGEVIEKGDNWVLSWLEGSGQKLDFGFEDVTMGNLNGKRVTFPKELEGRTISSLPTDLTGDSVALLWDDSSVYDLRACDCADRYFEVDSYPIKGIEKASVIGQAIVGIRDDHPFIYWMLQRQILDIYDKADDYAVIKDNDGTYVLVYVHDKKLTFVPISEWLPTEPGTPKDFITETLDCDVNGIYPNVDPENDDYSGLLLATDCGLVVRSPDGQYYGIAFKDEEVEFLGNENDLDGFVLVYLPEERAVYSAVVSLVENKYFLSEPIKVSEKPDAGSLSTDGYLVLSWGKEMRIYEFVDNRAYREIATFKLPFEANDIFADLSLNVYVLGEKEFLRLSGTVDDWVASGTGTEETGGESSSQTETQAKTEFSYTDDFNSLNRDFWYAGTWVTNEPYQNIRIEDGVVTLLVEETDRAPYLLSRSIEVKKGDVVVIERKAYVHYAGEEFQGELVLLQTNFSDFELGNTEDWRANLGSPLFAVMYLHYYYEPRPLYMPTKDGFALVGENWREDNYVTTEPVWDRWFEEKIVYDTSTGEVTYYLNGEEVGSVRAVPLTSRYIRIFMHPYGWYTGHYVKVDWITIKIEG